MVNGLMLWECIGPLLDCAVLVCVFRLRQSGLTGCELGKMIRLPRTPSSKDHFRFMTHFSTFNVANLRYANMLFSTLPVVSLPTAHVNGFGLVLRSCCLNQASV